MRDGEKLERLRETCEFSHLDFDLVIEQCRSGAMQFWDREDAIAVTSITTSGRFKTLTVVMVCGDYEAMPDLLFREMEEFGRAMGCDTVELTGRLGWRKLHRSHGAARGYERITETYRKDLTVG